MMHYQWKMLKYKDYNRGYSKLDYRIKTTNEASLREDKEQQNRLRQLISYLDGKPTKDKAQLIFLLHPNL
jgi:hypothetical protein